MKDTSIGSAGSFDLWRHLDADGNGSITRAEAQSVIARPGGEAAMAHLIAGAAAADRATVHTLLSDADAEPVELSMHGPHNGSGDTPTSTISSPVGRMATLGF